MTSEELEISRLTLRFNKAWLAETNPSHPEIAVAMSEYLSLTEVPREIIYAPNYVDVYIYVIDFCVELTYIYICMYVKKADVVGEWVVCGCIPSSGKAVAELRGPGFRDVLLSFGPGTRPFPGQIALCRSSTGSRELCRSAQMGGSDGGCSE